MAVPQMWVSQGGSSGVPMNDRASPILVQYHKFAFVFEYDLPTRTFLPLTTSITVFVNGIDDTTASPWTLAGYNTATVPANSVDVTAAYKGGAWSITDPCILLSLGILPEQTTRVIPAADGTGVTVSRSGGSINTEVAAQFDDFWSAMMHGSFANILPPGNNTMCSAYLGLLQLFPSGHGMSNAPNLSYPGQNRPEARYTFGTELFVEANRMNMGDFNPNRIQFTFGSNVTSVTQLPAAAALTDGDRVVVDCIAKVDYARVRFNSDASEYEGVELIDQRKIAMFRGAGSCFGL